LCKVLRLLSEGIDEEREWRQRWAQVRDRLQATPHVQPTAEEEEIMYAIGSVWIKKLKTIDERLRWKMQSDLLDIHGIAHVEGLGTATVKDTPEWQAAALTNSGDAWNALRLIFARLNADVQLRRTSADDTTGRSCGTTQGRCTGALLATKRATRSWRGCSARLSRMRTASDG
jgi:hypothetical protein